MAGAKGAYHVAAFRRSTGKDKDDLGAGRLVAVLKLVPSGTTKRTTRERTLGQVSPVPLTGLDVSQIIGRFRSRKSDCEAGDGENDLNGLHGYGWASESCRVGEVRVRSRERRAE